MNIYSSPVKSTLSTIFNYAAGSSRIALFMAAGDVIMQRYNTNKNKEINWKRTFKFATIGLCFMGPVLTCWKNGISIIVKSSQTHTTQTLRQLFWDQVYLAPSLNLGIVSMFDILEKESVRGIENRISVYFPYIMKSHYMLWPAVQFFGSLCIQPTVHVSFANFIAILWYAYISGVLHQDEVLQKP